MIDDRLSYPLSFRDSISDFHSGIVLVQMVERERRAKRKSIENVVFSMLSPASRWWR